MRILVLLLSMFFVFACSSGPKDAGNDESNDVKNEEAVQAETQKEDVDEEKTSTGIAECDDFLKDYEAWADEIIEVYKKLKEEPTNSEYAQKAAVASQKMAKYSEKWQGLVKCAQNEEYAKRVKAVEEKVMKAMGE